MIFTDTSRALKNPHKYLVCLGAGNAQLPLINAAKQKGYGVVAIDKNPTASGFSLVDIKIVESTYNTKSVIDALHSIANKHELCGLVARTSGPALYTASAIANEFDIPGVSENIVPLATEKSKLREFCENNGIIMPKGKKVSHYENFTHNLRMPLIVKPDLPLVGKKDVRVVRKSSDLKSAIRTAIRSSDNGFAEIEEFIEGIDVSALFLFSHGKVKILKYWDELIGLTSSGNIKAIGVSSPSVIEGEIESNQIYSTAEKIANSFPEISALIILSFRVDFDGKAYLIEMHADLGGDLIAEYLLPATYPGFNYFNMAVDASLNRDYKVMRNKIIPTCLIYNEREYDTGLATNYANCGKHFQIQGEDVPANLKNLSQLIVESKISLKENPRHEDWVRIKTKRKRK
jgi:biotin carboxylase